jgi:hypothetical protein
MINLDTDSNGKRSQIVDAELIYSQAKTAIDLLERLSADSPWAHRGSGYRGALLRTLDSIRELETKSKETQAERVLLQRLHILVDASFDLLEKAAIELIT